MGTDLTIVNSARVSFGNQKTELNDKDRRLIKFLVKHKHTSTFEHNVVTFKFGPLSATRSASTRIRLRKTQDVLAIAKLEDGSFIQDIQKVKVTIGGCGG